MYIYISQVCTHIHTLLCVCMCMCMYMQVNMWEHRCACIHTYIHMNVYMYASVLCVGCIYVWGTYMYVNVH